MLYFYLQLIETNEDRENFTLLYETYRKLMHWTAEKILHDEHLAEDAVHDAFLKIIQNLHQIKKVSCPETKSFVVIIVKNVALNLLKKQKNEAKKTVKTGFPEYKTDLREDELHSAIENISYGFDETTDVVLRKEIIEAVLSMPETLKETLLLYGYIGYSIRDIANYLNITEDAAYKRLQRARRILAKKIEKE